MKLKFLDLRENKITDSCLREALNFLIETVVLLWDNPFQNLGLIRKELIDPSHMFRGSELIIDENAVIYNPLHIINPNDSQKQQYEDLL